VPDLPEGLVLAGYGPGVVFADWGDTPRAEHFRVEKQIVGVDADFVRAETRDEGDATLTGLPSGKTLRVRIVAVNEAGPGAASAVTEIVVP
jgi:hypothetical protein